MFILKETKLLREFYDFLMFLKKNVLQGNIGARHG